MADVAPTVEALIDGAWVDISSRVLHNGKVVMSRGSNELASRSSPANCKFKLRNDDRRFSSDAPGALYHRKFVKGTPVRVRCTEDADPDRFYGHISKLKFERIVGSSDDSLQSIVHVEVANELRRIAGRNKPLKSALYRAISNSSPAAWWPFESGDERAILSTPSGLPGGKALVASPASTGAVEQHRVSGAVGGAAVGPPGAAAAIDLSQGGQLYGALPAGSAGAAWRFEISAIFNDPIDYSTGATGQIFRITLANGTLIGLFAGEDASETILELSDETTFDSNISSLVIDDGQWHHFRLDMSSSGGGADTVYELAVDGEIVLSGTSTGVAFGQPSNLVVSPAGDVSAASHAVLWLGTSIPADDDLGYHAFTGHTEETPVERLTRLCAEEGITLTIIGSQNDLMRCGPQLPERLEAALGTAVVTGQGVLYEPRDSMGLVYRTRADLFSRPPALTLDWTAHEPYDVETADDDDLGLVNSVDAQRDGGQPQNYTIPDTQGFWHWTTQNREDDPDGVGLQEGQTDAPVATDPMVRALAAWAAHHGSWREPRYPNISVHLTREPFTPALVAASAAVLLGDRVQIDNIPDWLPTGPILAKVVGETETVDQSERVIEWNTEPGWAWEAKTVDSSGSTLVVAVDDNDTSFKLATSSGPDWSTTDEPYFVQSNGEAIKVTGMTTDTPAFIAAGAISNGNNASLTPALPAGITPDVGQLLLIWATIRNSGTGVPDDETGWRTLVSFGNTKLYGRYYVTGDAAPQITFTGGVANADTQARMFAFSGLSMEFASGTKTTPAAHTQLNSSAANVAYPLLQVNRSGAVALIFAWKQDDWTGVAPPSGFTEMADNATTTGDDSAIWAGYDLTAVAAAAGSLTVTGGASAISRAVVLALRPLQTATVERGVNGTSVSIPAGTEVHTWRPGLNGL